jgi:hypothetical protein
LRSCSLVAHNAVKRSLQGAFAQALTSGGIVGFAVFARARGGGRDAATASATDAVDLADLAETTETASSASTSTEGGNTSGIFTIFLGPIASTRKDVLKNGWG